MRTRDRGKPCSEPAEKTFRRAEKRFSGRLRPERPADRPPGGPAARPGIPALRHTATSNLAQLQSEIQGGYDTHAAQIVYLSFSFGTTSEFRGLIATLGTRGSVRAAAGAIRIVLWCYRCLKISETNSLDI